MSKRGVLKGTTGKRVVRTVAKTMGLLLLAALVSAAVFIGVTVSRAPEISALDAVPKGYRSSVLDDEGRVVLNLSKEGSNRVYVKLEEIPEDLQHAFVAVEDERFYRHHGIDLRGILRAFWRGITGGGFSEGASTITQQLLKNNVFPAWTDEAGFWERLERKIQEQYLAVKLERTASKEWILENYLNTINLGGGSYGVETAARRYFGKNVSDLALSECAVLAAVTKNPSRYDPLIDAEANAERRVGVLDKMLEQGYITQEEREEALADPVYERIAAGHEDGGIPVMSYFEDELVGEVIRDLTGRVVLNEEEAWNLLYTGGLTIRSTGNSRLQEICEKVAADDSLFGEGAQTSIVVIDNATGQVKAMVGGRGEKDGSLLLNRATMSTVQPASAIKIIGEYAAALDTGGITLGTAIDDAPGTYENGEAITNADGSYGGMTTVRSAIVSSNNMVALDCFRRAGMNNVVRQLEKFGISTLTRWDEVEALALGATYGGVNNLEMTAAYATLARGGEYREPVYYTEILDREGNVLITRGQKTDRAVKIQTAELLTSAMEDVISEGTGRAAGFDGMHLAGKSGTSTDGCDLWFVGYSPYLSCGVWGGRDDRGGQTDTTYAQNVWRAVMQEAHEGFEDRGFSESGTTVRVRICEKCGLRAVDGLCDSTKQGDVTRLETFVSGTEPRKDCDCHIKIKVCATSGQQAGRYCRAAEEQVYLRSGTPGTADEAFVAPEELLHSACETHKHFWSGWYQRQQEETAEEELTEGEEPTAEEEENEAPAQENETAEELSWWEKFLSWFN